MSNDIYKDIVEAWRQNKGRGCIKINKSLSKFIIITSIIQKLYDKNKELSVFIVVADWNERTVMYEYIKNNDIFKNLKEYKIFTKDYMINFRPTQYDLLIYTADNIYDYILEKCIDMTKYQLMFINEFNLNKDERIKLESKIKLIHDNIQNEVNVINLTLPVKEARIGVVLDEANKLKLQEYNSYISDTINIFGSIEYIKQIKQGDSSINISGEQIRNDIAKSNGWSEDLDITYEFNRKIDELFNPNALFDRANIYYNIVRERNKLLHDAKEKLNTILDICKNNIGKKILIISKRSEYASEINNFINSYSFDEETGEKLNIICRPYHNKLVNVLAYDEYNNAILYKSGKNKGKQKMYGAVKQMSEAERLFNKGRINILSANNACNKDLKCNIDILIITSPFCDTINELRYRLNNLSFNNNKANVYKVYIYNSNEEKQLNKEKDIINHEIVNICENREDNEEIDGISFVD